MSWPFMRSPFIPALIHVQVKKVDLLLTSRHVTLVGREKVKKVSRIRCGGFRRYKLVS